MNDLHEKLENYAAKEISVPAAINSLGTAQHGDEWRHHPARSLFPFFLRRSKDDPDEWVLAEYHVNHVTAKIKTEYFDIEETGSSLDILRNYDKKHKEMIPLLLSLLKDKTIKGRLHHRYGGEIKNAIESIDEMYSQRTLLRTTGLIRLRDGEGLKVWKVLLNTADVEKYAEIIEGTIAPSGRQIISKKEKCRLTEYLTQLDAKIQQHPKRAELNLTLTKKEAINFSRKALEHLRLTESKSQAESAKVDISTRQFQNFIKCLKMRESLPGLFRKTGRRKKECVKLVAEITSEVLAELKRG